MIESFVPAKVIDAEFISIVHGQRKYIHIGIARQIYTASHIGSE